LVGCFRGLAVLGACVLTVQVGGTYFASAHDTTKSNTVVSEYGPSASDHVDLVVACLIHHRLAGNDFDRDSLRELWSQFEEIGPDHPYARILADGEVPDGVIMQNANGTGPRWTVDWPEGKSPRTVLLPYGAELNSGQALECQINPEMD
jgi:hypothetical protein